MTPSLWQRAHGSYTISTERDRLDVDMICRYLSEVSYWAPGRSRGVQERAIANSLLVVGAYDAHGNQVGFARMVTDLATFGWLADVFVLPGHDGTGLGTAMVETIVTHPDVAMIGRQVLATKDAHGLYAKFGYQPLESPQLWMLRQV